MTNISPKSNFQDNTNGTSSTAENLNFEEQTTGSNTVPASVTPNYEQAATTSTSQVVKRLKTPEKIRSGNVPTLRRRLSLVILPTVLIPLVFASAVGFIVTQKRDESKIQKELQNQALLAGKATGELLDNALKSPVMLAANPLVIKAAKNVGNKARADRLPQLAAANIDRVEERFKATRLLLPNQELNNYLKRIAQTAGVAELFFTDRYGFNVAYSNPTSDFVQNDEQWWQRGKQEGQWVSSPAFDESANTFSVDLVQSIVDPSTGEFLGVIKSVLASSEFQLLGQYLENTGLSVSQRLQIIDTNTGRAITTVGQEQSEQEQQVIGGEAIKQIAQSLVGKLKNPEQDTETIKRQLESEHSLKDFSINPFIYKRIGQKALTASFVLGEKRYTLATVPRTDWVTIASIDQADINSASLTLLNVFIITLLVLALVAAWVVFWLARRLSTPLVNLASTAEQVAAGNFNVVAQPIGTRETQTLASSFNNLLVQVRNLLQRQAAEAREAELLAELSRTSDSQELEFALNKLLTEARQTIEADRTIVYKFDKNWQGKIIAESVAPGWPHALGAEIYDPCFADKYVEKYQQGRVTAIENIYEAGLTECHINQLEPFAIKANLVVPINRGGELFGLLIAHQCSNMRIWQQDEVDYLAQFGSQIGISLSSYSLLERKQGEAERERQQKELLQQELLQLLNDVEGASQGDLTVRAEISASEIGIVADFFNAIIESLRDIVTQVKQAAGQVNSSVGDNEYAIRQLAEEALKQANQINQTLNSVEQMAVSIQEVANNAKAAAQVARAASETAETGGQAMDRTVETILQMRETVAETAKKVKRLGESSQQISKVISLINQIAMQTNLLAINAGIEAARAGEEGRGFAVVAEEVGQLAEQSAAATKEIEQIIENIQYETIEVAEAMELGTTQVVQGTRLLEETKQSLGKIVEVSRQIDQLVESISTATVSQAQTSQSVTNLIQEIAKISQKTSESSNQVSSSLQKTVEIANELQVSVSTFKVEEQA